MTTSDLSPRQEQIARLIDDGKTQAQIAEILQIHRRTLDGHLAKIRTKTNAKSTREAISRLRRG